MKLIPVLISLQLIFGIILLNLSNQDKKVLGLSSYLVQSEIPPEVTPEPSTPPETAAPSETPTEIPSSEIPAPSIVESTIPQAIPSENSPEPEKLIQSQTILEPSKTINFTEDISQTTINKAAEEDIRLAAVVDSEAKNNLIIEIAANQVNRLDKLIDNQDNTSANFITQRLNSEIETAINNLNSLPDDKRSNVQQKLINFCNNSDPSLRTTELSAPEEIQQDVEITRGLCQGI